MNSFVLFACATVLLSCANARPDLSLGYRYNQGHSSGGGSFLRAPGGVSSSYSPTASGNAYFASQPSVGQFGNSGFAPSFGSFGVGGGSVGGGSVGGSFGNSQYNSGSSFSQNSAVNVEEQQAFLGHLQNHQAPLVTKHFYLHTAPVDSDEQQIVRYVNIGRPQKNYRVVFIDAPSNTHNKAKIIANVAPTEEKTAIYVLSKKNNALDVSAEVVTPAPVNNKPEVFFIKYKTPEEAIHAQHTIQAQYDALGGSSDVSNEGPIPVSSVIGSLGGGSEGDDGSAGSQLVDGDNGSQYVGPVQVAHTGTNTQQTYLPANHK
ncbi:uncharacterized protein LOC101892600 [Musca domestica]|uniref:Uncharacterized protein LOC101892600 n=1 Tax=Musca domestica TaxID=7370 RepID=A0A1I8N7G9_MUSDO|nr:uncharacterized protein LOC101892600 [Musca domestica]